MKLQDATDQRLLTGSEISFRLQLQGTSIAGLIAVYHCRILILCSFSSRADFTAACWQVARVTLVSIDGQSIKSVQQEMLESGPAGSLDGLAGMIRFTSCSSLVDLFRRFRGTGHSAFPLLAVSYEADQCLRQARKYGPQIAVEARR